MIVATAGHVDHGKTELVKALTGVDTDRLPEEKSRGLSIDLGFAYQSLPDNTPLGFVDVPGHEKFIRNMLAGVGGIDLGLLVVAADDGVMPQTREHFAILDLLGIDQCMVAITKIDRVDDSRILEVRDEIENLLSEREHQVYPVCAPDNNGVDALKDALYAKAQVIKAHQAHGHFRLAIDRVFTLKGVGLVVTGMVFSGAARIDDKLLLSANAAEVRVRGIRAHNETSNQACAGERCALNISGRGVSEGSIKRGDWLLHPKLYAPTDRIDVDLRVLKSETKPLKHWTPTHLHIGADRIPARVAVLEGGSIAAGERGLAQLVLQRDVFVVHGDRFVLRDQSAQRTLAGGHVIDPFSPKRGRARSTRIEMLHALNQAEADDALRSAAALSESGIAAEWFATARNLTAADLDDRVSKLSLLRINGHIFSREQWRNLLERIVQAVSAFHSYSPALPGASPLQVQLAIKPHVATSVLEIATTELVEAQRLGGRGTRLHLPSHEIPVSEQDRLMWARVAPHLTPETGSPMSLQQAADAIGVDARTLRTSLKIAVEFGDMVQISQNRYLPAEYLAKLETAVEVLAAQAENGFTAAEFCKHIQTGRNFAIDLLEHFDRAGITYREGNYRRIRKP